MNLPVNESVQSTRTLRQGETKIREIRALQGQRRQAGDRLVEAKSRLDGAKAVLRAAKAEVIGMSARSMVIDYLENEGILLAGDPETIQSQAHFKSARTSIELARSELVRATENVERRQAEVDEANKQASEALR